MLAKFYFQLNIKICEQKRRIFDKCANFTLPKFIFAIMQKKSVAKKMHIY